MEGGNLNRITLSHKTAFITSTRLYQLPDKKTIPTRLKMTAKRGQNSSWASNVWKRFHAKTRTLLLEATPLPYSNNPAPEDEFGKLH